jgi:molybdopterin/thiamine biosynthesis adenylyltransferase
MREARVLLAGLKGLNSEVCKNLVLAGVNSVTILESEVSSFADLGAHLFLTANSVGQNVYFLQNEIT